MTTTFWKGHLVACYVRSLAPLTPLTRSAALCFATLASLACSVHGLAHSLRSLPCEIIEIHESVFTLKSRLNRVSLWNANSKNYGFNHFCSIIDILWDKNNLYIVCFLKNVQQQPFQRQCVKGAKNAKITEIRNFTPYISHFTMQLISM